MSVYVIQSGNNWGEENVVRGVATDLENANSIANQTMKIITDFYTSTMGERSDFEEIDVDGLMIFDSEKIIKYWENQIYWVSIELFKKNKIYHKEFEIG